MKLSNRKIQRGSRVQLQMTSMIDVVFLLLIFFMTTSSFVRTERNLATAIEVKNKSAAQAVSDLEPAIVEVIAKGDAAAYRIGGRELTSPEDLVEVLRNFENKIDGAFVRVSNGAPFAAAMAAVQACKTAGFVTVSYVPMGAGE